MEREEFRSNPFRGIPTGLISGFMYGCIILLIALALGMEEKLFIPLLAAAVILGGIIGFASVNKEIRITAKSSMEKEFPSLLEELFFSSAIYWNARHEVPVNILSTTICVISCTDSA